MSNKKQKISLKIRALFHSLKIVINNIWGAIKTFIVITLPNYMAKFKIRKNIFRFSLYFSISFFILLTIVEFTRNLLFLDIQVKTTTSNIWLICLLSYLWAALFTGVTGVNEVAKEGGGLFIYFMYYGMYTFWGFVWNIIVLITAITIGLFVNSFETGFYTVIAIYTTAMLVLFSYMEW